MEYIFHHTDPHTKQIEGTMTNGKTFIAIQNELDKCVLLCANCHRELHAGLITL